jgi:NAD(P)-dependent dehydrogenase (short-subunit alcohol dehydrogenase family)
MYLDRFKLTDRVALVTGGASGIGLAIVEALAEAGAAVTIADLAEAAIVAARQGLAEKGFSVDGVVMDVTDSRRVSEVADQVARDKGRIDILVNNAGSPAARSRPRIWKTSAG